MGGELSGCCSCGKGPVILDVSAASSPREPEASDREEERAAPIIGRARRAGIAAASVDKKAVDSYKVPVFEKDAATRKMLQDVIAKNEKMQVLFGHLKEAARASVVDAFFSKRVKVGDEIIRQGDEGSELYIVGSGTVDVYVARASDEGKLRPGDRGQKVVTLGAGALFGELALMYAAPRAATVVAATQAEMWALGQEPFKMLLMQSSQQQYALYEGWLSQVDIFKALNQFELAKLSELLDSKLYSEGEVIIKQGEVGDCFYLLEDGECTAFISSAAGEQPVKVYDCQGQYFGELALLNEEPRKATVRASGTGCCVASLTKDDFASILGPIKEILQKNAETYQKFAQHMS